MEPTEQAPGRLSRQAFIEQNTKGMELFIRAGRDTRHGEILVKMHNGRIMEVAATRRDRVDDAA